MPRPWTGNKPLFVRLTAAEIELLKQEKAQKKLYSLSAALEKAVCSMLHEVNLEQDSLVASWHQGAMLFHAPTWFRPRHCIC